MTNAAMINSYQNFVCTSNKYGVMHALNPISYAFVEHTEKYGGTALDIGSAKGVATIPVLERSNASIIACDISKKHLDHIAKKVREIEVSKKVNLLQRLNLIEGKFPFVDLEDATLEAVLASHVLPFLTGNEIEMAIEKIGRMLKAGGKFFALGYTIYNGLMKNYIPIYEQRKLAGDAWPGELTDASKFWDATNPLTSILPKQLNHLDVSSMEPILLRFGFKIKFLDFMSLSYEIPDEVKHDGREVIGLVAEKC